MKPKKNKKRIRLYALALSVYFAAFFLSTPNVISEERYGAHLTAKIMSPQEETPPEISLSEEDTSEKESPTTPSKPKKPIKDTAGNKKEEISTEKEEEKKEPSDIKPEATPPTDLPEAESPENEIEDKPISPPAEEVPSLPEQDNEVSSGEEIPEEVPSEENEDNILSVTATAYCGCYDCNGKWTGYPAADGSPLKDYHTIAADASIPFGTKVYIPFFAAAPNGGYFEVEDRGSAIVGNRIDIYFSSHSEALSFGMRELKMHILG